HQRRLGPRGAGRRRARLGGRALLRRRRRSRGDRGAHVVRAPAGDPPAPHPRRNLTATAPISPLVGAFDGAMAPPLAPTMALAEAAPVQRWASALPVAVGVSAHRGG